MVKLGKRVDSTAHKDAKALREWSRRFGPWYQDVNCDAWQVDHAQRRVKTIRGRIGDPEYLEMIAVHPEWLADAENAIARYLVDIEVRTERLKSAEWQFIPFWRNRPATADDWIRSVFFGYADEPDDALDWIVATLEDVGAEVLDCWETRARSVNQEAVPF